MSWLSTQAERVFVTEGDIRTNPLPEQGQANSRCCNGHLNLKDVAHVYLHKGGLGVRAPEATQFI
jgi:hypothetical protein